MKIKQIISEACELLARGELAGKVAAGSGLSDEENETVKTLLYCANAVEDELARNYFPLYATEKFTPKGGAVYFSQFKNTPVKIMSVKRGGTGLDFKLHPQYIEVNADFIEVEYAYSPAKKGLEDDSSFPALSPSLAACGVAAEYCLIEGEISRAQGWESRYREMIDKARAKLRPAHIPPRRWV